jgi:hypothetical protein
MVSMQRVFALHAALDVTARADWNRTGHGRTL